MTGEGRSRPRVRAGWGWAARGLELALVFGGLPLAYRARLLPFPMLAVLDVVALGALAILLADPSFDRRRLVGGFALGDVPGIAWRAVLVAAVIAAVVLLRHRSALLAFPLAHRGRWLLLLVLYPVFSALPQELLYRVYFFHRYRPLFGDGRAMLVASTAAFAFLHVVFGNVLSVGLTFAAGLVLGWRYARTRSLLPVTLEHALWGDLVFTLGLGRYFR